MSFAHRCVSTLLFFLLIVPVLWAQSVKTSIIIERQLVRFITPGEAVEWRLVVANQQGEVIYDSGTVYGSALEWPLKNQQGEAVTSGLYTYTLTSKAATEETARTQRGHLMLARPSESERVWITNDQNASIGADSAAIKLSVSGSGETIVGGAELPGSTPRRALRAEQAESPQRTTTDTTAEKAAGPAVTNGTANRVAKFDTNGTSLIDSAIAEVGGNVGIGTTSPLGGFDYRGSTAAFYTRDIGPSNALTAQSALQLGLSNAGSRFAGVGPSMLFFGENTAGNKSFLGRVSAVWENPTAGAEAGALFFQVRANNGDVSALTERMRITASGNVGIGTPNPFARLQVASAGDGATAYTARFQSSSSVYGAGGILFDQNSTYGWKVHTEDTGSATGTLKFNYVNVASGGVQAANALVLSGNGNVGIGTTNSVSKLDVRGNLALDPGASPVLFTAASGGEQNRYLTLLNSPSFLSASGLKAGGVLVSDDFFFASPGKNDLIVKGNVGIGTASPQSKLAVLSSTHGITQTDGTVTVGTYIDSTGGWLGTRSNHPLHFFTGNSLQQMTLSTSGVLGIGTTTPTQARLHANGNNLNGVYGSSNFSGVWGESAGANSAGLRGTSSGSGGFGVHAIATGDGNSVGVYGESTSSVGFGVFAKSPNHGVWGKTTGSGRGLYGDNGGSDSVGYAGYFNGRVTVTGFLSKGAGAFKIDHPLDPENKYLLHSFVESPDMMNIYNGNITTDNEGNATVTMPDWFEALNQDFRYQLTVIGQFAQAIVASKLRQNRFTIKTNKPHVEVSWQVTGIRHDAYARANRIPVEQEKPKNEAGYYLHPQAYGKPEEKGVEWAQQPELLRKVKEPRELPQQKPPQQQ